MCGSHNETWRWWCDGALLVTRTMTQHTSRLFNGNLTKKESDGGLHQMTWLSWTAELRKSSQQVLSICGNSFKTVEKAFLMKLVERRLRVCKAVIQTKGGYWKNKTYFNLFNTFLVTT
ncbi:unnamed protein product [Oncorhynchus mykiss]|uniref:Uncharacterized protein n=1 Tax=Oncorhynchus mykiss TaxID=8022 RepID=A0A060YGI3_ONCMY|nr:unnamed protein product [Oncorhynchus mykiss]